MTFYGFLRLLWLDSGAIAIPGLECLRSSPVAETSLMPPVTQACTEGKLPYLYFVSSLHSYDHLCEVCAFGSSRVIPPCAGVCLVLAYSGNATSLSCQVPATCPLVESFRSPRAGAYLKIADRLY